MNFKVKSIQRDATSAFWFSSRSECCISTTAKNPRKLSSLIPEDIKEKHNIKARKHQVICSVLDAFVFFHP